MINNTVTTSGIYIIVNIYNNKCYVGSSKNIYRRIQKHENNLSRNKHYNGRLQNSYNKHGTNAFKASLLEEVLDIENLFIREQYWIDLLYPWYNLLKIAGETRIVRRQRKTREEIIKNHCLACKTGKLSEEQVIEIINKLNCNTLVLDITKEYGVSQHSITDIKNGKSYKHLSYLLNKDNKRDWSPLSDIDVIKIIMKLNLGKTISDISLEYKVSSKCIEYIKKKKRRKEFSHLLK